MRRRTIDPQPGPPNARMKAIMYHYVRPDDPAFPHFRHLRDDLFERQLDYFAEQYRLPSREQFVSAVRTGVPIERGIILTFDDGLKDHFQYVLPALVKRGLFGIFYVPAYPYLTGRILDVHRTHLLLGRFGGSLIWESLLRKISEDMLSHAHVEEFRQQTYRNQDNDAYTNLVKRTLNYFIDYRFRSNVTDALMSEFFPDESEIARQFYLSETEMREMQHAGMILGSHTVNHPCMSKISADEQQREIADSFAYIERVIGRAEPKTFCYPYGGFHSFTRETENLLEQAGCLFSFNVEKRDITAADLATRCQALPRYDCNAFPPVSSN
jgi:peptidoglycan/xylan/chitin deacetylase (PgdA/CDA1 family)